MRQKRILIATSILFLELKNYIEQLLESVADECNVKEVILKHPFATTIYSFDTVSSESIGLDDEWMLWSLIFTGNIREDMQKVRDIVKEGLKQRHNAKIKVRQPLQSITVTHNQSKKV